jgi:hypothetical protein
VLRVRADKKDPSPHSFRRILSRWQIIHPSCSFVLLFIIRIVFLFSVSLFLWGESAGGNQLVLMVVLHSHWLPIQRFASYFL